jgi:gamma-glutamyl hercynylcysteine S-oxide synthase
MPATPADPQVGHELLERLLQARARTDELFGIVKTEFLYERPIPERHRVIFYIGHLEAFDWNLLRERAFGLRAFRPRYDRLFAFGIDPVDGGRPQDQPTDWPSLAEVRQYVNESRYTLDTEIGNAISSDCLGSIGRDGFPLSTLLNVAIEHRLMHAETLAYMLHQLPHDQKIAQPEPLLASIAPFQPAMVEIPPGVATLGLSRHDPAFGWDNEYELNTVDVPAFSIDRYEVTNGQYLEFIAAGGYENRALWSDASWEWKTSNDISHPAFWRRNGKADAWLQRNMFEDVPLPLDWPAYVSQAEAGAYARWAGKSLPTEAHWHRAAFGTLAGSENAYPWGSDTPTSKRGNFDFRRWDPAPVTAFPEGASAFGVTDLVGNGWEWTSTLFAPFPGFERFPFYPGYSADFFDSKHYVIKGGSARTAACMLRRSFRNWFQPHYQYVYAGFRCVRGL